MTKSTQILDVAYGTFSCRLEGFEDSVETMKTVVSYFHDLAGHDRFMDVAPQAPDMETLALLTAEQAGTDIEIAGEGQNVTLRAADEDADDIDLDDETDDADLTNAETAEDDIDDLVAGDDDDAPDNVFQADDAAIVLDADDIDDEDTAFDDNDFTNITDDDDYVEDLEDAQDVAAEMVDDVADAEDDDEEESIAAKLQRIRAVVGRGHLQPTAAPVATNDDQDEDDDDDAPVINPLAQRLADLAKRNLELAAADAQKAQEDDHDDQDADDFQQDADDSFADDSDDDTLTLSADTSIDGEDETFDDLHAEDDAAQAHDPLVLTPADSEEDDLETAEVDQEDDDGFDLSAELNDISRTIEERDAHRPEIDELHKSPDSAFSRILNQTDEHLNAPEGRRQRDAFAQLKAAVAATEAAREFGDDGPSDTKGDAFREDLGAHDAEEKSEARDPSPLRLVPSQTSAAPVDAAADRLRQIAAKVEENMAPKGGGFAEFAAEQGATDLSDLLEAAAAYIAFVEGDEDFSRPQVMKKVQSASEEEISREDGLRSFGRLLRQSKIVKLNNGRFQVSEHTRFRPNGTDT